MADKKLFELELGTPSDTDKIAYGKAGSTYKNITVSDFRNVIVPVGGVKTATFELGAWNMATTAYHISIIYKPLEPGQIFSTPILPEKLRSISVLIRNDAATPAVFDFLSSQDGTVLAMPQYWVTYSTFIFPTTSLTIYRRNGGYFTRDNQFVKLTNPDTTPYNRGWVTVTYVD